MLSIINSKLSGLGMVVVVASVFSSDVFAETPDISVSGFASFAYAKTIDDDKKDIVIGVTVDPANPTAPPTPIYGEYSGLDDISDEGDLRDLNRFGLRLNADLHQNLSLGAQLIANGEDDYNPTFDWLYVQYDFTPNVQLKLGRTTLPLFMYSDYLDATYAYQWIDAPYSVYGAGIVKTNNGFMLDWKASLGGGWSSLLSVFGGQVDELVSELDEQITIDNGMGIAWDVEYEWLRLRAVHYQGKSTILGIGDTYVEAINSALALLPAPGVPPYDKSFASYSDLAWEDSDTQYTGFGLGLDFEKVFFNAEATRSEIKDTASVGILDSWYAMIGTRITDDVSIAFTYGENKSNFPSYDYDELVADLSNTYGQVYQPAFEALAAGIEKSVNYSRYEDSQTYTLSGRWDFHPSAALKLEYLMQDTVRVDYTSQYIHRKPTAYRVGIDLVF